MSQLWKIAVLLFFSYYQNVIGSSISHEDLTKSTTVDGTCPGPNQIFCRGNERCVRIQYLCDGDFDCEDKSDEDPEFCQAWKNSDCDRSSVRCLRSDRSDCITISHYCVLNDPPCEGSLDRRICQILSNNKLQNFSTVKVPLVTEAPSVHLSDTDVLTVEFKEKMDVSIRHTDCPTLFTKVGDQCVSAFFFGTMNWMESRAFCQSIGGDLLPIKRNLSNFYEILHHFRENHMTGNFWLGGIHKNESEGWKWVDDTAIQLGTPIWAVRHTSECTTRVITSTVLNISQLANEGVCYNYRQAPSNNSSNLCTVMNYEYFHYVSDENCLAKKSPLCFHDGNNPKEAL